MNAERWGIGVVGLGGIAQHHLEGYKRRGLKVVAGAEPNAARRNEYQKRFAIPHVFESVAEMAAHPDVKILDITVPHIPEIRIPVVEAAAASGKALFIQKPLLKTLDDARRIVEIAESAGAPLMVNQNSLFVPGFVVAHDLIKDGQIGSPYYCQIENRNWFDVTGHSWFGQNERWITSDMGVHHYALVRHWFGPVESVYAVMGRDASQKGVVGETLSALSVRFQNGVSAVMMNNWCYRGRVSRPHSIEEIVVQGDGGALTANSRWVHVVKSDGSEIEREIDEEWFPDAFGYTMAHYVECLDAGKPWLSDGRSNLEVVEIIEAAYRSAAENRVVRVEELR
ncbi:MAG: Gfo/Idh/MocA family oxidoreductase [Candidatus Poribacteria bacterium]|nr:Gfo/Idh/MocA family oxidoreductase [Candidatus Poribacteria bacterium]